MQHSLIAKLIGFLLVYPLFINSALGMNRNNQLLSSQLELSLNQQKNELLTDLFLQKSFKQFNRQLKDFRKNYKDCKWSITTISNGLGRKTLDVRIKSRRKIGNQMYNLFSKQTIELETLDNKIKSYKIINQQSILNSQDSPLVVKIISPEKVLTGEKYEFNLIIEKPLDNSLIASGIIVLKNKENLHISSDHFGIKPNQSGGLFKYIQAPLEPGYQTISAIITHPYGIYSITKKIKVNL